MYSPSCLTLDKKHKRKSNIGYFHSQLIQETRWSGLTTITVGSMPFLITPMARKSMLDAHVEPWQPCTEACDSMFLSRLPGRRCSGWQFMMGSTCLIHINQTQYFQVSSLHKNCQKCPVILIKKQQAIDTGSSLINNIYRLLFLRSQNRILSSTAPRMWSHQIILVWV